MEKAKEAFIVMASRYEKIFESGFYPARHSTGFTEQNLVHSYVNALVNALGDDAIEWLEFPWKDKKQHIDAIVFSKYNKSIYYIEAKRFRLPKQLTELNHDIKRVKDFYHHSDFEKTMLEHNILPSNFTNHYIIALADIWTGIKENKWKQTFPSYWTKNVLPNKFEEYEHLGNLLQNSKHTSIKEFESLQNYKLLIAVESLCDVLTIPTSKM